MRETVGWCEKWRQPETADSQPMPQRLPLEQLHVRGKGCQVPFPAPLATCRTLRIPEFYRFFLQKRVPDPLFHLPFPP